MNKEELLPDVISYFNGDTLAANVWLDKYALKDSQGNILERTPTDMHHRLAKEFARIENCFPNPLSEEKIFQLLDHFKYIVPQGSPMTGVGNNYNIISLSNCFVIGNNSKSDSYGGIMRSDEEQIQLMKRRGGVGQDISHLRPAGATANNSALSGMAGAVLYAQRYSNSTKEVRQGDRRGALMLSMSIEHPDAEKFIDSKLDSAAITDANISVRITDTFMNAVENDLDFVQTFPVLENCNQSQFATDRIEYDKLIKVEIPTLPYQYIKKVKARKLWDKIINNAWKAAEPGVLFWDTIRRESPADCYEGFKTISTNPCGEIPLCEYDSCRLLVVNLYSHVKDPFTPQATFQFEEFRENVFIAQRLMDDLVELEAEKIEQIILKIESDSEPLDIKHVELQLWKNILRKTVEGRRTGLGVVGEGDMLAAIGLTYGSDEAIKFSVNVHKEMAIASYKSSINMADEREPFTGCNTDREANNPFIKRVMDAIRQEYPEVCYGYNIWGRRNISNLTISPTGTTSLMTQTSSGVEPCFNVYYKRRRRTIDKSKAQFTDANGEMFEEYYVFHHKFVEWYDKNWYKLDVCAFDLDFKKELGDYTEEELKALAAKSPYHKATAQDVNWVSKVKMQGAIQKWVDHSISATTNIPKDTPVETVNEIYKTAYKSGCKGMTIYREGSRSGILLTEDSEKMYYIAPIKRPKELDCDIYHKTALKTDWMILVGRLEGKPYEIFAFPEVPNHLFPTRLEKGRIIKVKGGVFKLAGQDESGKPYELTNFIDLIDSNDQVNTRKYSLMLRNHIDPKVIVNEIEEYALITSFDKVIQRVLRNYIETDGNRCPICGGELTREDGCVKCVNCGWGKCG